MGVGVPSFVLSMKHPKPAVANHPLPQPPRPLIRICVPLGAFPCDGALIDQLFPTLLAADHSADLRNTSSFLPYGVVGCSRRWEEPMRSLVEIGLPLEGKDPSDARSPVSGPGSYGEGEAQSPHLYFQILYTNFNIGTVVYKLVEIHRTSFKLPF